MSTQRRWAPYPNPQLPEEHPGAEPDPREELFALEETAAAWLLPGADAVADVPCDEGVADEAPPSEPDKPVELDTTELESPEVLTGPGRDEDGPGRDWDDDAGVAECEDNAEAEEPGKPVDAPTPDDPEAVVPPVLPESAGAPGTQDNIDSTIKPQQPAQVRVMKVSPSPHASPRAQRRQRGMECDFTAQWSVGAGFPRTRVQSCAAGALGFSLMSTLNTMLAARIPTITPRLMPG